MPMIDLGRWGLEGSRIVRNAPPAILYEEALRRDGAVVTSSGVLATRSGARTAGAGRQAHRRVAAIRGGGVVGDRLIAETSFRALRRRAIDYLNTRTALRGRRLRGMGSALRMKVRIICSRPYHALFMHNMLIRPTGARAGRSASPDCVDLQRRAIPGESAHDRR